MKGYCRVCPVCNGIACAGEVPGMGGLGTGAAAIVISDHGGRLLDHLPGAAEVLPEIAAAVGDHITIMADGGVRSGVDVLKMLALGANAVLIGRPFSIATVGGLEEGVTTYIDQLKNELLSAMVLTGCKDNTAIDRDVLRPPTC